jgi:hypothetical protein
MSLEENAMRAELGRFGTKCLIPVEFLLEKGRASTPRRFVEKLLDFGTLFWGLEKTP